MIYHTLRWKEMVTIIFLIISFTSLSLAQNLPFSILLRDKDSGQPLTGATLVSLNSRFRQASDSTGQFTIPVNVRKRGERLQFSMVGHTTVILNARQLSSNQVILLEKNIASLAEVVITSNNPVEKVRNIQMGADLITASEARKLPAILGEVDIIKILQLKPGVKTAGEGLAGLYIRGGGADQNLILIDNTPVYNPNHLLGLFSVFNNDALREVKLFKAAYPAVYGGRLSSVLDVAMRPGSLDSTSISGGIGLLSSRLSFETPVKKGRSSVILSGRRTYFDLFTTAINRAKRNDSTYETIPPYYFSDLNFRGDWHINDRNFIWATGYWGSDNFKSSSEDFGTRFTWGNQTASLNWKSLLPQKKEVTATIFYSSYKYTLSNQFSFNNLVLRSGINTLGLKLVAQTDSEKPLRFQAGLDGMVHSLNIGDFKASSDLGGFTSGEKIAGNEWGLFANSEWDRSKNLSVLAGLRLSGFYADNQWNTNAEPRLGARVNVSENAAIKVSLTRMYQYLHLASLSAASLPTDIWYPSTGKTKPQYADQASIGWSQAIQNNVYFFSVEGYYKWMKNQVEFRDGANVFGNPKLENDFVFGRARAYGAEVYLEKKQGKTTGWIGYTLSRTTRIFADINDGKPFKPRYDRRHDFSFVFMHRLNNKFTLSGTWIFGSGSYITVPVGRYVFQDQVGDRPRRIIPVYGERSNYQLAPVHRLDLSLVMSLKSKKGSKDLTFSLYNAYSRRNPFFIQFREVKNESGYVTSIEPTLISLFPVLPGITYNFKF